MDEGPLDLVTEKSFTMEPAYLVKAPSNEKAWEAIHDLSHVEDAQDCQRGECSHYGARTICPCLGCADLGVEMDRDFSSPAFVPVSETSSDNFFQRQRASDSALRPGRRVRFNVGGMLFETSIDTIMKDQNSYFSALLLKQQLQEGKPFFIDRDGERFRFVLNYLRNGTICTNDISTLEAVLEEALYFQLNALQEVCEEKIRQITHREEEERKEMVDSCAKGLLNALVQRSNLSGDLTMTIRIMNENGPSAHQQDGLVFSMNEDF